VIRRLVTLVTMLVGALWVAAGDVAAYPVNILHAHTSTAASHKFTIGDSTDRLQTQIKCSTTSGGIYWVSGPWVGRDVWSQAYCPPGSYRASEAVMLRG
jgi:hypothetical protein